MLSSKGRRLIPWAVAAACAGVALFGLIAVMGLGTDDRFAEDDVVIGRDADGVFFATCPEHVVDEVVIRAGQSPDAPVILRGKRTGEGSRVVRAEPSRGDYDVEGATLADLDDDLSVARFTIDSGVAAIPAYVTFNPSNLKIGTAVTGSGDLVSVDSWTVGCD
jgi:hypothetical protein